MLVHVTLRHAVDDCPSRRPDQPLPLLGPSGKEADLTVLWSAACILLAAADHVAFVILDAYSADAARSHVATLVPETWTVTALAVLNLPAQLPLVNEARKSTVVSLPEITHEAATLIGARQARRVSIVASAGPAKGRTFAIDARGASIGRLPENVVYVPDERLSREHARIDFRDGGFWLADMGSRNGTALNGALLTEPRELQSGDTIEVGGSMLVVSIEPSAVET
jgi:FHA domain